MRGQLMRVRRARIDALTSGDARRAARLAAREERIEGRIVREQHALTAARRLVAETDAERRRSGAWHTELQREERARFLDAQAALPARGRPATDGERRDYVALAGLAGHGRAQFEALDTRRQRQARLQIDRELALRRELRPAGPDMAAGQRSSIPRAGPHRPRDGGTLGGESAGPTAGRLPEAGRRPPGRSGVGQGEPRAVSRPGASRAARPCSTTRARWRQGANVNWAETARDRPRGPVNDRRAARAMRLTEGHVTASPPSPAAGAMSIAAAASTLLMIAFAIVATLAGVEGSMVGVEAQGAAGAPGEGISSLARAEIPAGYLRLYRGAARRYGLDWAFLAAIGKVECDHGRDPDPSCTREGAVNSAGAGGPMQFIATTWARYGVDGDSDGRIDRWDPGDAIYSAANYLRASGAPTDNAPHYSHTTTPPGMWPRSNLGQPDTEGLKARRDRS